MKVIPKPLYILMVLAMLAGMLGIQPVKPVQAANPIRISQAYGAGGNTGATYTHDFIEIFNSSTTAVNVNGWSVQYASSAGTSWQVTALTGTIPANSYYLIQEGVGNGGTTPLPTPDATGAIAMQGASNFKVALVDSTTALTGSCPTGVVDFLGGGSANCSEGSAAPVTTSTTALIRKQSGCQDTDVNADDFEALAPTPRNTSSPTHSCGPVGPIPPVINEFSASTTGDDVEFVEIFGTPNTDYSAYTILEIEGDFNASNNSEGFVDEVIVLGNTDANGLLLVNLLNGALENGTISLLLVKDNTATLGVDIDTDDNGVIDVTYWSEIIDGVAVTDGGASDLTYTTPVLAALYDGLPFAPGGASRIPDGTDTDTIADWVRNDFDLAGIPGFAGSIVTGEAYNTPGASNQVYVETAPSVVSTNPANSANHPIDENITITFSELVTVTAPWFSISCGSSGSHTATVNDADPVYVLNPDVDFTVGESCTVTITAANVVDDDIDDATFNAMLADYSFSFNAVTPPERCGDPFTPTYVIQGNGETSPLAGTALATEGVVVGDFQVGGKNGYYIQDVTGDGDPATSDGIFVYNTTTAVNPGDHVRVRGTAVEYFGITEISPVTQVWVCSTGNTVTATEVTLPVTAVSDFEKYESMLVTFPQSLIISEYFNYDRYGEIVLTSERHMTPTALVEPGAPAQAEAAAYLLDRITLDDGRTAQNPDPAIHPNGLTFNMTNLFRGGGTVTNATGILDYYQSLYRLQPTTGADYADVNPRAAAPDITEADLKVVSFNVLNYFVTLTSEGSICGPAGNQGCRGADNAEEFARQKAKIVAALAAIDADVYGLMEIENDSPVAGNDAVADLVAGLNAVAGAGTYDYIETGSIGGDVIKQAILYKPASVTPVGEFQVLDSSVDSRFIDDANRPVLAQAFADNVTDVEFVVAVNHLKSKGSACDGDPDLGDGQGNCNLTRLAAAEALVDWLANPTYFPDVEKTLIIGDLNSYDKEDPIDAIKLGADDAADTDDDYLDMIFEKQGDYAYGYVFDGQTGYLDHALANLSLAENIADVNFWHINADEPDLIDYDTSFKLPAQDALYAPDAYRSSDHDPVIVTMSFTPLTVTEVALVQSTDLSTWTPVEGDLAEGYVMNLDTTIEYYYLDAETLTSNRPLADGSYPFFMTGNPGAEFFAYWAERGVVEGATGWQGLMWQIINGDAPMFELKVEGTSFTLIDGLQGEPNPLRVNGGYYPGLYTFSGVVTDLLGFGDTLDVSILFNDIPVAEDQAVTTPEDTAIDITLAATDIEGEALVYTIAAQPAHGTVTLVGNIATYTPALDFVGEDSFTFTANDGTVASNIATVTITVTPINDAPEAVDDAYDVDEDDVLTVAAPGVMANDVEVDTDGMRVVLVSGVSHGELDLMGDGSFTYTPDSDFTGTDSFVYKLITFPGIQDDWTDEATVTITVNPINDAPVAEDQDVTTAEDTAKEITLVATDIDGDELTYAIVDEPLNGTLTLDGDVATYTPDPNFVGEDSFTFTANDGTVDSDMAVVDITVTPVNDAPVAVEDAYNVDEDTVLTVLVADGVLDNDSDVDGDPLTAVLVGDVSNGTLVLDDDGSFVYTPDENYFGSDSFTYKASDGTLESDTVTVTITVNSINDWVIANDDEYETMAGVTLEVAAPGVLTNDVLLDPNETVSLQVLTQPAGGTLTLNTDGSFTYVPNAGFFGVDTFEYQLNSTQVVQGEFSDIALVTITVTARQIFLPLILR